MSLAGLIDASAVAALITNPRMPDNPIVACNDAFARLTGYARGEVLGRNCRFLAGPLTEPHLTRRLSDAIRLSRPVLVEILNYRKDGSPFRNAVMIAPIFAASGAVDYYLGSQMEVGDGAELAPAHREAARARVAALSPRQSRILLEMAAGKRNKQIAFELGLSERTVKVHRAALLKGLGVRTSAEAIRLAVESGIRLIGAGE